MSVSDYLELHRDRHLAKLCEFAAFPSISGSGPHAGDVYACAVWLRAHLQGIGLNETQLLDAGGNPVAFGQWLEAGPDAPTILIYGHYDVQPADPYEAWTTAPFRPVLRDGKLFARGISDNKGPIFCAMAAIEATLAVDGRLPCNVKVIVEGEEELRADRLDLLFETRAELLAADLVVNTDGSFLAPGCPSVPLATRGMVALDLTVSTGTTDLHSGVFGGVVPNALHVLTRLLSTLHDEDGRILVDGFYDDVLPIPETELAAWSSLPIDDEEIRRQAEVFSLLGGARPSTLERQWALPTLDLNGIWGGYSGERVKTVIPAEAHAKLSCRLVPGQEMGKTLSQVKEHLLRHLPAYARLRFDYALEGTPASVLAADPAVDAAHAALQAGFGTPAVTVRVGFSVPINDIAGRRLGTPTVMLQCAYPTDAFHAPDEHFTLESFDGGIRSMLQFMPELAARWER